MTAEVGEVQAVADVAAPIDAVDGASIPGPGVVTTATALTFVQPAGWLVALAGFLAHGGVLLILLPIVVMPSTADLVTAAAPLVSQLVLGTWSIEATLAALVLVGLLALVVVGLLVVGGAADGWLVAAAADELGRDDAAQARPAAARLAAAWLIGQLPFVAVAALALAPVYEATYLELTAPGDPSIPVALRVMARIPDVVALTIIAFLGSTVLAALAVRQVALEGASIIAAVPRGLLVLGRRPLSTLAALGGSVLGIVVLVGPAVLASTAAFAGLRDLVADGADGIALGVAAALLVASWLGGLVLIGVAGAWRSYAWTAVHLEAHARRRLAGAGPSRG
jgi:hypothetical protein